MDAMDKPVQIQDAQDRQTRAAAERYDQTSDDREANQRQLDDDGAAVVDSVEQLEARATRLVRQGEVPVEAVLDIARAGVADRPALLERIIGASKDLQAVSFLSRGARAAATVGRISLTDNGRELPLGTGFLVSPRLLMTNNHVLADTDTARRVVVEFGAEVGIDNVPVAPTRFRLAPDVLYLTDEHLDYSLVAVQAAPDGRMPGEVFGWNRLVVQQGKIVTGEAVNVVGHPMGRLKEISIRNNRLALQLEDFLHYETDTEPGNSGSPVFNDQWEIVALHHSGVPRMDDQGRCLRRDGRVWQPGDGDDAIDWVANEGARISVVLSQLNARDLTDDQRALLAEMGLESGLAGALVTPATGAAPAAGAAPAVVEAAAPARRGLAARPTAFGGTRHLLFLHGRGQEGRDPQDLRRSWTAGLNEGLTLAGLSPIDAADVHFPFYGDRLAEQLQSREAAVVSVEAWFADPASAVAPAVPSTRLLYEEILGEAAAHAGMPPDLADDALAAEGLRDRIRGWVVTRLHRQLSWLAARSGLDDLAIAREFRDVAAYLDQPAVRRTVLDAVRVTLPAAGELVLVGHSLGSVVAADLLTELPPALEVRLWVTAGSPLGLDSVYRRLLSGGPRRPNVGRWLNTWAAADTVAIGCPLGDDWPGQLDEVLVENPKERAHSIEEYLSHSVVARPIRAALS
jgi:endonuclease G, mitochondrial